MKYLFYLTFIAVFICSSTMKADPNWNAMSWSPLTIDGDWTDMLYSHWAGPLVVQLDGDGAKEIIVTDNTTVKVYEIEGDDISLNFSITLDGDLQEEGYKIHSIPSVGDLTGNGENEIVFTDRWRHCERTASLRTNSVIANEQRHCEQTASLRTK